MSQRNTYYVDINSNFRDLNKYPNPMDYAVSFRKFQGTGTFLNGLPLTPTSFYEECSIDPDFDKTHIQVENGFLYQTLVVGSRLLVVGSTDVNVDSNTLIKYQSSNLCTIVNQNANFPNSYQTFCVCFVFTTNVANALTNFRPEWITLVQFGQQDAKVQLTSTNEVYFMFNFNKECQVFQQFGVASAGVMDAFLVNAFGQPAVYSIPSAFEKSQSTYKNAVCVIKQNLIGGSLATVNGVDWGYHLLTSTQEISSSTANTNLACDLAVDNANNLLISANAFLQPQSPTGSGMLFSTGGVGTPFIIGGQSDYLMTFANTGPTGRLALVNCVYNAISAQGYARNFNLSGVSINSVQADLQQSQKLAYINFRRYADYDVSRNCFVTNTDTNIVYSVAAYARRNYSYDATIVNIDIYKYNLSTNPPTASIVASINTEAVNVTASAIYISPYIYIISRSSDTALLKVWRFDPATNAWVLRNSVACPSATYHFANVSATINGGVIYISATETTSPISTQLLRPNAYTTTYNPGANTFGSVYSLSVYDGCQSSVWHDDGSGNMFLYNTYFGQANIHRYQFNLVTTSYNQIQAAQGGWLSFYNNFVDELMISYSPNIQATEMWVLKSAGGFRWNSLGDPFQSLLPIQWSTLYLRSAYGLLTRNNGVSWELSVYGKAFDEYQSLKSAHYTVPFSFDATLYPAAVGDYFDWVTNFTDFQNRQYVFTSCNRAVVFYETTQMSSIKESTLWLPSTLPVNHINFIQCIELNKPYGSSPRGVLLVMYSFESNHIWTFITDLTLTIQLLNDTILTFYNYVPNGSGGYTPTTPTTGVLYTLDTEVFLVDNTLVMMAMAQNTEYFLYKFDTTVGTYGTWVFLDQGIWYDPVADTPQINGLGTLTYYPQYQQLGWIFNLRSSLFPNNLLNFYSVNPSNPQPVNNWLYYPFGGNWPQSLQSVAFQDGSVKTLLWYSSTLSIQYNINVNEPYDVRYEPHTSTSDNSPYGSATGAGCALYYFYQGNLLNFFTNTDPYTNQSFIVYSNFTNVFNGSNVLTTKQNIPLMVYYYQDIECMQTMQNKQNSNVYLSVLYATGSMFHLQFINVTTPQTATQLSTTANAKYYYAPFTNGSSWIAQMLSNGSPGWADFIGGTISLPTTGLVSHSVQTRSISVTPDFNHVYACGQFSNSIRILTFSAQGIFPSVAYEWNFTDILNRQFGVIEGSLVNNLIAGMICKLTVSDGKMDWFLPLTSFSQVSCNIVSALNATTLCVAGEAYTDTLVHLPQNTGPDLSVAIQTSIGVTSISSAYVLTFDETGVYLRQAKVYTNETGRKFSALQLVTDASQLVICGTSNANVIRCKDGSAQDVQTSYSSAPQLNIYSYFFDHNLGYKGSNIIDLPSTVYTAIPAGVFMSSADNQYSVCMNYIAATLDPIVIFNKDGSVGQKMPPLHPVEWCSALVQYKYKYDYTDETNSTYSRLVYHNIPAYTFTGGAFNNYNVFVCGQPTDTILNNNFGVKNNARVLVNADPFTFNTTYQDVLYLNNRIDVSKIVKKPLAPTGTFSALYEVDNVRYAEYFPFQLSNAKLNNFVRVYNYLNVFGDYQVLSQWSAFPSSVSSGAYFTFPDGSGSYGIVPILNIGTTFSGFTWYTVSQSNLNWLSALGYPFLTVCSFNQSVYYSLQFFPGSLISPQYYDITVTGLTIPDRPLLNGSSLGGLRSFNDYPYLYLSIYSEDDAGRYDTEFVNVIYDNTPLQVRPYPQFLIPVYGLQPSSSNFVSFGSVLQGVVKFSAEYLNLRVRLLDPSGNPIQFDQTPYKASDLLYTNGIPDSLFNMYIRLTFTKRAS